jgi:hypothetical protein
MAGIDFASSENELVYDDDGVDGDERNWKTSGQLDSPRSVTETYFA